MGVCAEKNIPNFAKNTSLKLDENHGDIKHKIAEPVIKSH